YPIVRNALHVIIRRDASAIERSRRSSLQAPSNPYGWLILVLLLLLSAFFSAAEAALLAANKLRLRRLRDDGDRRARQLSRLLEEQPGRVLTALAVGNTIVKVGASTLVTEEEIRLLVRVGEEEGVIEADQRQMIHSIFEFGDTVVREVMVPRIDMVCVEDATSVDGVLRVILEEGHSRVPVYHDTI